jgi:tetratricopeptide (TPR) repeat protein
MKPGMSLVVALTVGISAGAAVAQEPPPSVGQLYESGKNQQVVESVMAEGEAAPPDHLYLAGQSLMKLESREHARDVFGRLINDDEASPWRALGVSATAVIDGDYERAYAEAARAVELAPDLFYAHYQVGLTEGYRGNPAASASAFERAIALNPGSAYAHYYAGMAHYKARRVDQMGRHFEQFVKLAPEAPERPAVESIMRSLRGR